MKTIGSLPNLEVLKVRYNCFSGPVWETCDGGFCNLKFLELCDLDIQEWISSDCDHFPSLQFLMVMKCRLLLGIPLSFGDSMTLQKISVYQSSYSAEESAREIQKLQQEWRPSVPNNRANALQGDELDNSLLLSLWNLVFFGSNLRIPRIYWEIPIRIRLVVLDRITPVPVEISRFELTHHKILRNGTKIAINFMTFRIEICPISPIYVTLFEQFRLKGRRK
ncbi:hypothetical protein HAX54_024806 [Datura stramonium]|uniref:Uncharacterized protein n=1 Tax=Datura stramonium TaxID=4076 RepID=A0ABS8S5R0_DATST|nr:hypothetical protein [Datura stramonium]